MQPKSAFIPAMRFHWLTPVFDLLAKLTLPDADLKNRLIDQAELQSGFAPWIYPAARRRWRC